MVSGTCKHPEVDRNSLEVGRQVDTDVNMCNRRGKSFVPS